MNPTDFCLDRLFRAARRHPAPFQLPAEAPFHLECRILASWRRAARQEGSGVSVPLIRGAFVCACAILIISTALALKSWRHSPPEELVSVDSAIQLTLTQ